jgi:hypothetical protein
VSLPEAAVAVTDSDLLFLRARAEPLLAALTRGASSVPASGLAELSSVVALSSHARPHTLVVALDRLRLRAHTLLVSLRWAGPPLPVCVSFSGVPVTLSAVDLVKPLLGHAQLRKELLASVVADALVRAPAVLGSSELLGNPTAAVRTIADALTTALEAPFVELAHLRAAGGSGWVHAALLPIAAVSAVSRGVFSGLVTVGARTAYAATSSFGSLARSLGETMTAPAVESSASSLIMAAALPDVCDFVDLEGGEGEHTLVEITGDGRGETPAGLLPALIRSLLVPVGAALRVAGEASSTVASTIQEDGDGVRMASEAQCFLALRTIE